MVYTASCIHAVQDTLPEYSLKPGIFPLQTGGQLLDHLQQGTAANNPNLLAISVRVAHIPVMVLYGAG